MAIWSREGAFLHQPVGPTGRAVLATKSECQITWLRASNSVLERVTTTTARTSESAGSARQPKHVNPNQTKSLAPRDLSPHILKGRPGWTDKKLTGGVSGSNGS